MFRLFSLFGMAFLAAAAVALTTPTPVKVVRRERRLTGGAAAQDRGLRQTRPNAAVPLYYARFSLN
jgi:hypothetical protein